MKRGRKCQDLTTQNGHMTCHGESADLDRESADPDGEAPRQLKEEELR